MRDIKFRAFDNEKMVQWPEWAITFHGQLLKEYAPNFEYLTGTAIPPIMQYTGLKDETGREVYEGDLITNHGVTNDMKQRIFEIVWVKDTAKFAAWDAGARMKTSVDDWDMRRCEIIGNIYENPELLK